MGIPFLFASLIKHHPKIIKLKPSADFFAIDMNCLIHHYLNPENPLESVLIGLKQIIEEISIEHKNIYIAFDGLVPMAKIVQQRYRRFKISEEPFDKKQISPDTPYMRSLESRIKKEFPEIYLSPTQEPGEGEHKIFLHLNSLNLEKKNIIIYGLDADLILLSLQRPENIFLMRDGFLDIQELKKVLPVDPLQFLYLSVLCFGNDFMPNLGMFSLREYGYERCLSLYEKSGSPDLREEEGRQQFLEFSAEEEISTLKNLIRKRGNIFEKFFSEPFSRKYNLHILDGVLDSEPVVEAFWKTFDFTIKYFLNNEAPSWEWYYPYPDAPLIQDIILYEESQCECATGKIKFKICNQLQFILPSSTLKLIGRRVLYKDEFYTETRHPWLKRYDWEMKPRISLPLEQTLVKRIL
jgi:5'-3' exonuclease